MTSRLERLFVLLETGQSGFIRQSAACQIGEIVRVNPNDLEQLIERIKPLVSSSSWDTRIAASQTIESILNNLNDFDLISGFCLLQQGHKYAGVELTLEEFDLNKLLSCKYRLLGTNTQKYDVKDATSKDESIKEKLREQRSSLYAKLNIDVAGAAKLDTQHIFSDYDLLSEPGEENGAKSDGGAPSNKRKESEDDPNSEDTEGSKKIKLESEQVRVKKEPSQDDQSPQDYIISLNVFTNWLLSRLYEPEWEIRHGAATCLREIVKKLVNALFDLIGRRSGDNCLDLDWFEMCLCKLLRVIALDRFADYIGDETVAPVRETCTQSIGIISKLYTVKSEQTRRLCQCLVGTFLNKNSASGLKNDSWEIKHAGIMILKYTIAAALASGTQQTLEQIFEMTFDCILECICDTDDDVRQTASSSLEPVSKQLNQLLRNDLVKLEKLIKVLLDVLSDLDDLGTSCASIMSLLSDLLSSQDNQALFIKFLNGQSILPRLLPFLSHPNLNVKQTTLSTINKIINAVNATANRFETIESEANLVLLLRLLYQQAILMSSEAHFKQLESTLTQLWHTLCHSVNSRLLITICFPYITTWIYLFMWSPNQQIDAGYLINENNSTSSNKEFLGSNQIKFEDKLTKDTIQIKCRLLASRLLAILFQRVASIVQPDLSNEGGQPIDQIIGFLSNQINFKSGLQRFCFGLLVISICGEREKAESAEDPGVQAYFDSIRRTLGVKIVKSLEDENTIYFDEIAHMFTRLQKETKTILSVYHEKLIKTYLALNLEQSYMAKSIFTFEDINALTSQLSERISLFEQGGMSGASKSKELQRLVQEFKLGLTNLIDLNRQTSQEQEQLQIRSLFALACCSIDLNCLTERVTPMIRPLIECIRFESNADLQLVASQHLAKLLSTCVQRQPNPAPKIFKNLLNYMCSNDPVRVPVIQSQPNITTLPDKEFYEINRYYGILSDIMNSLAANADSGSSETTAATPNKLKRNNSVNTPISALTSQLSVQATSASSVSPSGRIEKRGAELTIKSILELYNDRTSLQSVLPDLLDQPVANLTQCLALFGVSEAKSSELEQIQSLQIDDNAPKYQDLVTSLALIEYVLSIARLNTNIIDFYLEMVPNLLSLIKIPLSSVRNLTSRGLANLCKQQTVRTMSLILEYALDCLNNNDFNLFARQGGIELIYCLLDSLGTDIIPYIVIFIVPVLKRMCDLDWYVRSMASQCFATLVKLYPLALPDSNRSNSLDEIAASNERILQMKIEQQDFLDQLMDNSKLKDYLVPAECLIDVKLRPYQQMGVNWLAFLKKFNLHGILCDDMGLGKTIQSICILAGDHHEKAMHTKPTQVEYDDDDLKFKPSIIICPSTLTNHWHHEIERFVNKSCLRPFIYSGSVAERESLRKKFFSTSLDDQRPNIFIVSYDIIRHDIQYLCRQTWNYCILDEGHLIKSSKTKLSKAIKQIRAAHRLILSGTPIQNNVTELWCLFDFLLPGYLGTEKQFYTKYAKYVQHSVLTFQQKLERSMSTQVSGGAEKNTTSAGKSTGDSSGINEMGVLALESLHKQVLPFLLRRTKEEVLQDLPPKIIQDYYCDMSQLQIELYHDFAKKTSVSRNIKKSLGLLNEAEARDIDDEDDEPEKSVNANNEHVFQALQYLRKVVNHPSLVLTPDHPKWGQLSNEFAQSGLNDIRHSGKLLALRELLLECGIGSPDDDQYDQGANLLNQHRVLIFCQLKSMIDIIEHEVLRKMRNVSFLRLDGTIPVHDRFNIVKKFNSDPSIDILLLTTQIGGLGLNLTGADTVIFVEHDWNPQKDLQAMDRAHRIGQTKVVNVYRLITKKTIEEKIMSLQKFKLSIANSVVNIENSSLSSMGTEQLMNMFNRDNSATNKEKGKDEATSSSSADNYQRLLNNIGEIWDESQYENEYDLNNFIKSLK